MSRRLQAALLTTVVAALPALAASDDSCTREMPRAAQTTVTTTQQLEAIFAKAEAAESMETNTGVTIEMPSMEVVIARRDANGKIVLGCVDSATAAKRFLAAQIETIPTKAPAEQ